MDASKKPDTRLSEALDALKKLEPRPTAAPDTLKKPEARPTAAPDTLKPEARPTMSVDPNLCPRCGGKLTNPESLGWCPKCSYCRSLEQDQDKVATLKSGPRKPSPFGIVEFAQLIWNSPRWAKILFAGMVVVLAVSYFASKYYLPRGESYTRALWSTIQLGAGLLVVLVGQFWALTLLAPKDDKLGAVDAFIPFRLWSMALNRLPLTDKPVWAGAWGMTAMVCAVLVTGGLEYWKQFYNPKKIANPDLVAAAGFLAKKKSDKDLTESVKDFAKMGTPKEEEKKKDTRQTVSCIIIGYLRGEGKMISGLILATVRNKGVAYAGVVNRGFTAENSEEMLPELAKLVRPEPVEQFQNLVLKHPAAIWVEPKLFCEVHYFGVDRDGVLINANFKNLMEAQ
jgi:hypothetical protein